MNIQPHECLKSLIQEIHNNGRCNNRAFTDNMLLRTDDPIVHKLWQEMQDYYLFRIYLLRMYDLIDLDDCFCDMETWNRRHKLAMEDLRGFCWCCALRQEGKECHHEQKAKCEWWQWDGFRRLNQDAEADVGGKPCCWWRKVLRRGLSKAVNWL